MRSLFATLGSGLLLVACASDPADGVASSTDALVSEPKVLRDSDGALRFLGPTLARVADCSAADACADADHDGLVDAWEDAVLDRLRPAVTFDEDEPLIDEPGDVFSSVGRVSLRADGHVTVNILLLYTMDYGAPDAWCFSISKHPGDVERVAIDLELLGGSSAIVRAMFTTGHEGTDDDQSRVWKGRDLKTMEAVVDATSHDPRWRVYASQAKHATYWTKRHCEDAKMSFPSSLCVHENCAPDGVKARNIAKYTRVPAIANAGEPDHHRLEDLRAVGFPTEQAWSDSDFCGGNGPNSECPPSVKSKLLRDPFAP